MNNTSFHRVMHSKLIMAGMKRMDVAFCLALLLFLVGAGVSAAGMFCGAKDDCKILWQPGMAALKVKGNGGQVRVGETIAITFEKQDGRVTIHAPGDHGWDLGKYVAVAISMENAGRKPVTMLGAVNSNRGFGGFLHLMAGTTDTMIIFMPRQSLDDARKDLFVNMRGVPGGYMSHWTKCNPQAVSNLEISDLDGSAVGREIKVKGISAVGGYGEVSGAKYCPFVDEFGQFCYGDWPGKIKSSKDLRSNALQEKRELATIPGPKNWSKYGGWMGGPKLNATGNFRTEKYGSKWWLVDPDGYLYWAHGITCVGSKSDTPLAGRENYFKKIPQEYVGKSTIDFSKVNQRLKYGDSWETNTRELAHQRLHSWGMNSIGNWSDPQICLMGKTAYTIPLPTGISKENIAEELKNPVAFRTKVRGSFARHAQATRDDPWCVGYFVDNEIKWKGIDPELYHKIISEEVKRAAPLKLYLGSRINGGDHSPEARAAVKYCDVVSFNRYQFSPAAVSLPDGADLPVIIGEFHVGALDRGMLHTGLCGVSSQRQRAFAYKHYVTQALTHPNIVGTHWFQYREQAVTGRFDGENYQIGFVDVCDTPYPEIVAASREIGNSLYQIRTASTR